MYVCVRALRAGIMGILFALSVGRFIRTKKNVVPWFSTSRMLYISAFLFTGIIPFIIADSSWQIIGILAIWGIATIPQIILNVTFSLVMNAVAGPKGRYRLLSRRWSIFGFINAVTAFSIGMLLEQGTFPLNFQVIFIVLSFSGVVSYLLTIRIVIPDNPTTVAPTVTPAANLPAAAAAAAAAKPSPPANSICSCNCDSMSQYYALIRRNPPFTIFVLKRFVYWSGLYLGLPLFPLYYVRVIYASDASIGIINTGATAICLIGYLLWSYLGKARGSRFVLLLSTFGSSLHAAAVTSTQDIALIAAIMAFGGFFQSGTDLVFFDELLKTIPMKYSAEYVALSKWLEYLSYVAAPLIGTTIAGLFNVQVALYVSSGLRLLGSVLFCFGEPIVDQSLELQPTKTKVDTGTHTTVTGTTTSVTVKPADIDAKHDLSTSVSDSSLPLSPSPSSSSLSTPTPSPSADSVHHTQPSTHPTSSSVQTHSPVHSIAGHGFITGDARQLFEGRSPPLHTCTPALTATSIDMNFAFNRDAMMRSPSPLERIPATPAGTLPVDLSKLPSAPHLPSVPSETGSPVAGQLSEHATPVVAMPSSNQRTIVILVSNSTPNSVEHTVGTPSNS